METQETSLTVGCQKWHLTSVYEDDLRKLLHHPCSAKMVSHICQKNKNKKTPEVMTGWTFCIPV